MDMKIKQLEWDHWEHFLCAAQNSFADRYRITIYSWILSNRKGYHLERFVLAGRAGGLSDLECTKRSMKLSKQLKDFEERIKQCLE